MRRRSPESRIRRSLILLALGALPAAGCKQPLAGPPRPDAAADAPSGDEARIAALWEKSRVRVGVGDTHNLLPQESGMVKAAADARRREVRKCFENVVLQRGCRTNGIPAAFDAMLMIQTDGTVREMRIVPNKNDLPRECHDAVGCVQDVFGTMQIQGLTRFEGARQAYMTVTLVTPDETALDAADGGD